MSSGGTHGSTSYVPFVESLAANNLKGKCCLNYDVVEINNQEQGMGLSYPFFFENFHH